MNDEPHITINGAPLSEGEAMTFRVALESFALDLRENGLGNDEHASAMVAAYLERIDQIRQRIFKKEPEADK